MPCSDDDRHRSPGTVGEQVNAADRRNGGDTVVEPARKRRDEHTAVRKSHRVNPGSVNAQVSLDTIEQRSCEPDIVGEYRLLDGLEVEVRRGRSTEVASVREHRQEAIIQCPILQPHRQLQRQAAVAVIAQHERHRLTRPGGGITMS